MLSDEEKRAIKIMKEVKDKNVHTFVDELSIILNLIEKQQKEIEELKAYKHDAELTKISCCTAQNCEALNNCIKLERELQNADKKWEDKIKAKIEESELLIDNSQGCMSNEDLYKEYGKIEFGQSLLEKE